MQPKILFRGTTKPDLEQTLTQSVTLPHLKINFTTDLNYALSCAWQYASDNKDRPRLIIIKNTCKFSIEGDKTTQEWYSVDIACRNLNETPDVEILTERGIQESARYHTKYSKKMKELIREELRKKFAQFQ